ncbi:bifunctional hydroxymethylpyrimidine kinase/phosphomethylpyrimidine kinase [Parvibaculum sp.]|uniref:bifunctional hydroxymethylpyrimidine kinase/phosphomethylpyrimidine kinase n=1 Tax=Parvibaculum sp. TaxID=2024848 RepID=UPI001D4D3F07|nr:bifunctional hydroxymethylpyrimidine kinase/phosphomethylpyrimidine kinase [Parvibaculum sp.]MBX3488978.1 bifunctional hydroxymethylpyrimidine kinase/phosphomethylpyrimidine kinase [Parvibaculum sp.]MCW5727153.1 bifunctional hydroxymethylpyrimidine kinase/phosphomethylpyrimidine kinase [Parvibaculum sp.]
MNTSLQGRVLIVAGSDSGGGAGIQADIKSVTAMGGFAMTAVTAITVQNTLGVHGIHDVPVDVVRAQMKAVLDDIGADAVKTGMLHSAAMVEAVAAELGEHAAVPFLVVDPVMVAKGGASLLEGTAVAALKEVLIPLATLVTPNVPEAEALTGRTIVDLDGQKSAADALLGLGCDAVLVKGGHLEGATLFDVLATQETIEVFSSPRIETRHTHGTGCTLASAIAALLAQGIELSLAVETARDYVHEAIRTAPGFGKGNGPLNFLAALGDDEEPSRHE